jgi:hypothetical protein
LSHGEIDIWTSKPQIFETSRQPEKTSPERFGQRSIIGSSTSLFDCGCGKRRIIGSHYGERNAI